MVTKPSTKTVVNSPCPTRPGAAQIGISFAMRARGILHEINYDQNCKLIYLDPVPVGIFHSELSLMQKHGYKICELEGNGLCAHCGCNTASSVTYYRRHKNGKQDYDSLRSFEFCFQCMHVTEAKLLPSVDVTEIHPNNKHQDDEIDVTVIP